VKQPLRVPFGEIKVVRLVCKRENCGGVAEIPVTRLEALVGATLCPSCGQAFPVKALGGIAGLKALGISLTNLVGEQHFMVEFVVPDPGG
jgi:hypothetical protein